MYETQNKEISARKIKKKLEIVYQNIRMYGLQIHRSIYYVHRFDRINKLLNDSNLFENTIQPILSSEKP